MKATTIHMPAATLLGIYLVVFSEIRFGGVKFHEISLKFHFRAWCTFTHNCMFTPTSARCGGGGAATKSHLHPSPFTITLHCSLLSFLSSPLLFPHSSLLSSHPHTLGAAAAAATKPLTLTLTLNLHTRNSRSRGHDQGAHE